MGGGARPRKWRRTRARPAAAGATAEGGRVFGEGQSRKGNLVAGCGLAGGSPVSHAFGITEPIGSSARKNLAAVSHLPNLTGNEKIPKTADLLDLLVGKPIQI